MKLPKSFVAINLSEKLPQDFSPESEVSKELLAVTLPPAALPASRPLEDESS
ncbi:MAG: hypothetical protein INR71_06390 [Terriglobus roseus]|nr:hypothetical protein [Terriglobus roseus]